MVTSILNLTRNGSKDFLWQRVSAFVLGAYSLFWLFYAVYHLDSVTTFTSWQHLFAHPVFKIFTFCALVALLAHAWIGVWTIITDYIKPFSFRLLAEVLLALISFVELIWGVMILWS